MKYKVKNLISFTSLIFLFIVFYFVYSNITSNTSKLIKFDSNGISSKFELEISNNFEDIDKFISKYIFIKNYKITNNSSQIKIEIEIKKPFAKNNLNKEIVFHDNSTASYVFFNKEFINSIKLVDISSETLKLNNYLNKSYNQLSKIFKINQIEYIDDRRYDLYVDNNKKVMLPKIINQKFLVFLENNLELLKNNMNFKEYIDLRNFHLKTIRVK